MRLQVIRNMLPKCLHTQHTKAHIRQRAIASSARLTGDLVSACYGASEQVQVQVQDLESACFGASEPPSQVQARRRFGKTVPPQTWTVRRVGLVT